MDLKQFESLDNSTKVRLSFTPQDIAAMPSRFKAGCQIAVSDIQDGDVVLVKETHTQVDIKTDKHANNIIELPEFKAQWLLGAFENGVFEHSQGGYRFELSIYKVEYSKHSDSKPACFTPQELSILPADKVKAACKMGVYDVYSAAGHVKDLWTDVKLSSNPNWTTLYLPEFGYEWSTDDFDQGGGLYVNSGSSKHYELLIYKVQYYKSKHTKPKYKTSGFKPKPKAKGKLEYKPKGKFEHKPKKYQKAFTLKQLEGKAPEFEAFCRIKTTDLKTQEVKRHKLKTKVCKSSDNKITLEDWGAWSLDSKDNGSYYLVKHQDDVRYDLKIYALKV